MRRIQRAVMVTLALAAMGAQPTLTTQWERAKAAEQFSRKIGLKAFPKLDIEAGQRFAAGEMQITSCDDQMVLGRVVSVRPYVFHDNSQVTGVIIRCEVACLCDRWPAGSYCMVRVPEGWAVGSLLKEPDGGLFYWSTWQEKGKSDWTGVERAFAPAKLWRGASNDDVGAVAVRFCLVMYRAQDAWLLRYPHD